MTAIKFEIDGQMVAPEDASWYLTAPCGCCCGVSLTVRTEDEVVATEEQMWRVWEPNAEKRKRQRAAGFTTVLGLRADVKERVVLHCPHTPTWGVERTPVPDGYCWAAPTESPRRKHLVADEFDRDWLFGPAEVLCGNTTRGWTSNRSLLMDLAECVRCQRRANALAPSSPVEGTTTTEVSG